MHLLYDVMRTALRLSRILSKKPKSYEKTLGQTQMEKKIYKMSD